MPWKVGLDGPGRGRGLGRGRSHGHGHGRAALLLVLDYVLKFQARIAYRVRSWVRIDPRIAGCLLQNQRIQSTYRVRIGT